MNEFKIFTNLNIAVGLYAIILPNTCYLYFLANPYDSYLIFYYLTKLYINYKN